MKYKLTRNRRDVIVLEVEFSQAAVEGTTAELADLNEIKIKEKSRSGSTKDNQWKFTLLLLSHNSLRKWNLDRSGSLVSFLFNKMANLSIIFESFSQSITDTFVLNASTLLLFGKVELVNVNVPPSCSRLRLLYVLYLRWGEKKSLIRKGAEATF